MLSNPTWKCKFCDSICNICHKTDRRKRILQCQQCPHLFHKICKEKAATPPTTKDICISCEQQITTNTIPQINNIPQPTIKFSKGMKIGHVNCRDICSVMFNENVFCQSVLHFLKLEIVLGNISGKFRNPAANSFLRK
jgi:hypothetical protein